MKKEQKEQLRAILGNELRKVFNERMIDYIVKETEDFIILQNGMIILSRKPKIETSFCFGYRLSSVSNEEYDEANEMCRVAKNNEQYFINENMRNINLINFDEVEELDGEIMAIQHYRDCETVAHCISKNQYDNNLYNYPNIYNNVKVYTLTKEDVQALKDLNERRRNNFMKRLNTYLKKYGLSKVRSWSYWQDA